MARLYFPHHRKLRCYSWQLKRFPNYIIFLLFSIIFITISTLEYKFQIHNYLRIQKGDCYLTDNKMDELRFILRSVTSTLEEMNVTYWLDYGTLIGAYRNGDVMRHDTDGDISTLTDKKYALDLYHKLDTIGIRLVHGEGAFNIAKIGGKPDTMWVDINKWKVIDGLCEGKPCKMIEKREDFEDSLSNVVKNHEKVPLSWIFPLKRIDFAGFKVYIPNRTEDILKNRYPLTYRWTIPYKAKCWLPW